MTPNRLPATIGMALAVLLVAAGSAEATTIDPLLWEQMILEADLVAIVECTRAGGSSRGTRSSGRGGGHPSGRRC